MVKRYLISIMLICFSLFPGINVAADEHEDMPTVFVRQDGALGAYLTDPDGMTLYMFTNDTVPGESTCTADCAAVWPPVTADEPLTLPMLVPGELSLIDREDGSKQLAYNDIPLYYWSNDQQPGDTTGHGVKDHWYVVAPGMEFGADPQVMASPVATDMGTPAAAGDINVTLTEYSLTADVSTLQVGQEYTFQITNEGVTVHEFVLETAGAQDEPIEMDDKEMEVEDIQPGSTETLTVTFTEAGSYQISCWIEGHFPAGMVFNLKVVD